VFFTKRNNSSCGFALLEFRQELRKMADFWKEALVFAQPVEHTPVNELHSIENTQLTNSFFRLTKKIQGVKHNCSLTVSEVFPVGAASGGQAKSP